MESLDLQPDSNIRITPFVGNDTRDTAIFLYSTVTNDHRVELSIQGDTSFRNLVGRDRYTVYLCSIGAGQPKQADVSEFFTPPSKFDHASDFMRSLLSKLPF